jgi:hypothetical protein
VNYLKFYMIIFIFTFCYIWPSQYQHSCCYNTNHCFTFLSNLYSHNNYIKYESWITVINCYWVDCLCGLVVRVPGYRSRGPQFDSRCYQIFWDVVWVKWLRHEAYHSHPSSAEVKNGGAIPLQAPYDMMLNLLSTGTTIRVPPSLFDTCIQWEPIYVQPLATNCASLEATSP